MISVIKAKLHYVFTTTMFLVVFSSFAQNHFFSKMDHSTKTQHPKGKVSKKITTYTFNYDALHNALEKTHYKTKTSKEPAFSMSFPNANGVLERFRIVEASVLPKSLQAKYPHLRSYVGYGIDNPSNYLRFSLSPNKGLSGTILGQNKSMVFEPVTDHMDQFEMMPKSSLAKKEGLRCLTKSNSSKQTAASAKTTRNTEENNVKRVFRLALSVTGEYAEFHGGTLEDVNAALAASLTNVNAVFEKDLNISLELVENNDAIVFLDPFTDPYSGATGNLGFETQRTLDSLIGSANYDVGHLLSAGPFDGNANCVGCVCDFNKGSGYSSDNIPGGFNFDIDLFAHELGHQFGANHTWTHLGNEQTDVQMEPGSGTTVMGYSGIANSANILLNSDPYFHAISIAQISSYVASTGCATTSTIESTPLIVEAGENLTLPIGTPFKLEGNVEGIDSNAVTYCWEQVNENNARTVFPNPDLTDSNAILFRSFPPTANNARFFPNFKDLLIGLNAGQWEKIPNVSRTADFRLTVRDNRFETNNVNYDDVQVNFDSNYGPFKITTLNANNIFLVAGETQIIQWDVNNTNLLPGASTVNIQLSTDGGTTFETIASNVPNNGSYLLEIPDITASNCRLMIAPTNANFFTVNGAPFTIGLETDNNCVTYNSSENLNLEILDSFDAIQSSTISITATGVVSDINVGVNIVHDFIGDLGIVLTSPSGTQVVLKSPRSCGDDTDLIATFDDEAIAFNCSESGENLRQGTPNNTLLSAFNGEIVTGDWTIEVGDFSGGDQGLFKSWFIELCNPTQREFSIDDTVFGAFTVSPNPSLNSGIFKIRANALHLPTTFRIEVYNTRGQIVYDESFAETSFFNEIISIANVGTGLYFLNLTDGNGNRFTRKLLIR